jgi:glutamate-5-semialdehyde dehydrogenase
MACTIKEDVIEIARQAKEAVRILATASTDLKNKAILSMAEGLIASRDFIIKENKKDLNRAKRQKLSSAFIDRLTLTPSRIADMSNSLRQIAALEDPVGKIISLRRRPNGLLIGKMRVSLGTVCIIYESRPNVTSDCAGLLLKSANSAILRGGREAFNSNMAIYKVLKNCIVNTGLPEGCLNLIPTTKRIAVDILLGLDKFINLVIPRGGESLIREVSQKSRIPVIKHYKGICHIYVDSEADLNMAGKIIFNAKVQRPGVCNAVETVLINEKIAKEFLPNLVSRLKSAHVEVRGCPRTKMICRDIKRATERDWSTEYLDLILSVRVVSNLAEAIEHISRYGSQHSEAIITENYHKAMEFLMRVDSACVYVNASTRFTDGNQFGLGAEIGISTDKLHARGPMALEELTSYKYIILGSGQIRK